MTIKLGFIGCGEHSVHHAKHAGDAFSITALWDPNQTLYSTLFAEVSKNALSPTCVVGSPSDESLSTFLAECDIDAVFIGSPDTMHMHQIELALTAGKHVLCEKPLVSEMSDLDRLVKAFALAEEKGLVLTSCHPRRFDAPFLHILPLISGAHAPYRHKFGKPIGIEFDFSYHEVTDAWKLNRSLLLDHLNHELDLANYLFGISPLRAWCMTDPMAYDRYEVAGVRADGITVNFRGTRLCDNNVYPEWAKLRFERGSFLLNMMEGWITIEDHDAKASEISTNHKIDYEGRLRKVMSAFADEIAGKPGYLSRDEMLMNTVAGLELVKSEGRGPVSIRSDIYDRTLLSHQRWAVMDELARLQDDDETMSPDKGVR